TVTAAETGQPLGPQLPIFHVANAQGSPVTTIPIFGQPLGSFDLSGLSTGTYFVSADGQGGYLPSLYNGQPCRFSTCEVTRGTPISVVAGATSTISIVMTRGGTITGTVRAADTGAPVSGVSMTVPTAALVGRNAVPVITDSSGLYTVRGLEPGHYHVQALPGSYQGLTSPAVTVSAGNSTTVDLSLPPVSSSGFGSIAGSFAPPKPVLRAPYFGSSGGAFANAAGSTIAIYDVNGALVINRQLAFFVTTSWPTSYRVDGLPPGQYFVRYDDPAGIFSGGHPGISSQGGDIVDYIYGFGMCVAADCDPRRGQPVTVSAGTTTTGIDIPLVFGGAITPQPPTQFDPTTYEIYDDRGVLISGRFRTPVFPLGDDGRGFFGLPPGTYYVRRTNNDDPASPFGDCPDCAATSGRPFKSQGADISIVPVVAPATHAISGTVRDATTHAPVSTITVEVYDRGGHLVSGIGTTTDLLGRYSLTVSPSTYFIRTRNDKGYMDRRYAALDCGGCEPLEGTPVLVGTSDVTGIDFDLTPAGLVTVNTLDENSVALAAQSVTFVDSTAHPLARETASSSGIANADLAPGTYYARTEPSSGHVMTLYGAGPCARGQCDVTSGTAIPVMLATVGSISIVVPSCAAPEVSPRLLASGVAGRAYRQILSSSHPSSGFLIASGRVPAGMALDASTGALSGTPTESGVFPLSVAAIDPQACAGAQAYTLQIAKCTFTLSSSSTTMPAAGGAVDVTASDVCGFASVTASDTWVTADASSVASGAPLHVTVAPNAGSSGRSASVFIGRRVFSIFQAGAVTSAPFGSFDTPSPDGSPVAGSIAVSGWALDDVQVKGVRIYRDPVAGETLPLIFIGDAVFVDGARPDVERVFPSTPFNTRAGWGYLLLTNMLPNRGNGIFRLHAIAEDAEGNTTELGVKTIVGTNNSATFPFGAIDTPGQGETVSGTSYVNFGWVLTPQPKAIATDGSTIQVVIDGVSVGRPNQYNLFRPDVSGLFPGLVNSPGPVGLRVLDTTTLAEGTHTIAWLVTDSAGKTAGIGSRFFTVRNSADAQPAGLRAGADFGRASVAATANASTDEGRSFTISSLSVLRVDLGSAQDDACAATYAGYLDVNGELRELPVGATLAHGQLSWHPGPAFHGRYQLTVIRTDCEGKKTSIPLSVAIR
ncbi:MAG TPA: carboxypeptidase regulatory-like domain-containing protein, partial [Vicinamibacterales bacterium]|nr:carboxypeptidase regulatory-like domain-containing protein [Vicinamibacterales bacterium]